MIFRKNDQAYHPQKLGKHGSLKASFWKGEALPRIDKQVRVVSETRVALLADIAAGKAKRRLAGPDRPDSQNPTLHGLALGNELFLARRPVFPLSAVCDLRQWFAMGKLRRRRDFRPCALSLAGLACD